MASMGQQKQVLRSFMGAEVLWPPDCPDDILQAAIKETKTQEPTLSFDKDGQKIAENLKKFMDQNFEPYWHVFLGNNFGCHAIHQKKRFLYFYYKKFAFLIYKAQ